MTGSVEHQGSSPLLARCAYSHDIESAIPEKKRRSSRKAARFRRVQYLDFDSHTGRHEGFRNAFSLSEWSLYVASVLSPRVEPRARNDESEENPPSDFHLRLFQSATVSGKM
jgi:hypothetical protein